MASNVSHDRRSTHSTHPGRMRSFERVISHSSHDLHGAEISSAASHPARNSSATRGYLHYNPPPPPPPQRPLLLNKRKLSLREPRAIVTALAECVLNLVRQTKREPMSIYGDGSGGGSEMSEVMAAPGAGASRAAGSGGRGSGPAPLAERLRRTFHWNDMLSKVCYT
jgi:hypothetical protein